jgi:hypothetical protein
MDPKSRNIDYDTTEGDIWLRLNSRFFPSFEVSVMGFTEQVSWKREITSPVRLKPGFPGFLYVSGFLC